MESKTSDADTGDVELGLKQKQEQSSSDSTSVSVAATLTVQGMTCASCVGTVERAVQALDFVSSVNVNLLAETANVVLEVVQTDDADARVKEVLGSIDDVGFDAELSKPWSVIGENGTDGAVLQNEATLRITVTGMTCASCSGTVTRAIEGLAGEYRPLTSPCPPLLSSCKPFLPSSPLLIPRSPKRRSEAGRCQPPCGDRRHRLRRRQGERARHYGRR